MTAHPFTTRHIGITDADAAAMLQALDHDTVDALIDATVPDGIRQEEPLALTRLGRADAEQEVLAELRRLADSNVSVTSLIGQGYYGTITPPVIMRNMLENPAWYTAYTPYQPEISQGRLEALLNFQTMVADLTGMPLANASLLDEGTAAAEAMTMASRATRHDSDTFLVDADVHPQTLAVLQTRAEPLDIKVQTIDPWSEVLPPAFGILLQYPGTSGEVRDLRPVIDAIHEDGGLAVVAADLLALTILAAPGDLGADIAVGTSQRFGIPMWYGGPHAGYLATSEAYKRTLPGRLVGVSVDAHGDTAYRLALQTREQHIRREKATSNICTAQVLLANAASMYAAYHGPDGLTEIATRVRGLTAGLFDSLRAGDVTVVTREFFDTLTVAVPERAEEIARAARRVGYLIRVIDADHIGLSLDETSTPETVAEICAVFGVDCLIDSTPAKPYPSMPALAGHQARGSEFLTHPVFNIHRSETSMMRYLRALADKDLALDRTMIPLGSCTMKLNAVAEMEAISWPEFADVHPFAPEDTTIGSRQLVTDLEQWLADITGYDAVSLQPNSGAQGELAGLLAIRGYHASRGESYRDVCLIPSSAHGTNAASAVMAGMRVVVVSCDEDGNVDVEDLGAKADEHSEELAALMVTYPSTHGVFETAITEICRIVHDHGGQVYLDGANLNALVGLAQPGRFGADVSHLNLHKTFCIPHGGGGPGVGPIGVGAHLAPFLPGTEKAGPVTSAPYGSAGILAIPWAYLRLMGGAGLTKATRAAILSANYIAARLRGAYDVLYTGEAGAVAHECIIDIRPITKATGVTGEDIAKRLIDYGFHAPTMSFPVAGTLMIEPTESEPKAELDRFIDAMLAIRTEIAEIESGDVPYEDSLLAHAPFTALAVMGEGWDRLYSRERAAFPAGRAQAASKFWPPVGRVDNAYGDKNLMCSCPPVAEYE
ncbi:aminomethyl-transferring glycine dehydrogenase [Euzebya tangerina]|uniref:aminomethyl-transferring glycine dehydrogenase n=1 Tax=Euzebya tangerina TaxID=591198 RepID=UPI000E31BBE4|nr:aminomethyl-transferring glycine dehydrogenase [Euzebya tangerina]